MGTITINIGDCKGCVGSNLFDSWKDETLEEQRQKWDDLGMGNFVNVEPYHPPSDVPSQQERHDYRTRMKTAINAEAERRGLTLENLGNDALMTIFEQTNERDREIAIIESLQAMVAEMAYDDHFDIVRDRDGNVIQVG